MGLATLLKLGRMLACCALAGMLSLPAAQAADYPNRRVRIIVPYPPGGTMDNVGRLLADYLSQSLKQPVIVENKAGAGGVIGALSVARAKPDGHTLLLGSPGLTTFQIDQKDSELDLMRDLAPISQLMTAPYWVAVSAALPVKTLPEFVAYTREHRGKINYGSLSGGQGLAIELFKLSAKADLFPIPFNGESPTLAALAANEVQMTFSSINPLTPFVDTGRVRVLGITSRARLATHPDIPTVSETVAPGFDVTAWAGLLGPKGMPDDVRDLLAREAARFAGTETFAQRIRTLGYQPTASTPAEFGQLLASEINRWSDVARKAGRGN
ncbi:Bug family tripartite tricarboxylate transporter substrate binding protein [Pigmentiphaga kullae]|uniref:Tripartite-type tricarboxylate transporter receptor subunit TctC n=1 Tax=Pigmentiphaga kullae TaxID=151784 RepID=A0A4Q7NHZ6_9BURK|nr:tripartite tricarboxylate transporter substrate binding protein [Pigmentiphaga kullae]RZS84392.1 tripartite-type tricarboxylate transporter receptor subunit TctC [Pigmentiphaga kullae]